MEGWSNGETRCPAFLAEPWEPYRDPSTQTRSLDPNPLEGSDLNPSGGLESPVLRDQGLLGGSGQTLNVLESSLDLSTAHLD